MFKITLSWVCFASVCVVVSTYDYLPDVKSHKDNPNPRINCNLPQEMKTEVAKYKDVANRIINEAVNGSFKGRVYKELAIFADKFGPRVVGSDTLENSIDYLVELMTKNNIPATKEQISTPIWRRGPESLKMIEPREQNLSILSFGFSVGTPTGGIQAEALVVTSFEELAEKADQAPGKIIVFNQGYVSYPHGHMYRQKAAPAARKVGGVAALVRSVTPFSMETPHTGMMSYEDGIEKIPCVAITVEAADMFLRMSERGEKIVLRLETESENIENGTSHNAIGRLTGATIPDEIVIVSGHIDSWDVGQGVVDDAGGVFISTEVLNLLNHLELRPKRSIDAIAWTSEELGIYGAIGFMETHKDDIGKYVTAFEADSGVFKPLGLDYAGSDKAGCVVQEILKLLEPINATNFRTYEAVGTDIDPLTQLGVPSLSLNNDGFETNEYFWYHHSAADTMTVIDSDELDLILALWTVSSYVIADLSVALTKLPDMPPTTTQSTVTTTQNSSGNVLMNTELIVLCSIFILRKMIIIR